MVFQQSSMAVSGDRGIPGRGGAACLVLVLGFLAGCAHVTPGGQRSADGSVPADGGGATAPAPGFREFVQPAPVVERRGIVIPQGFVRSAAAGDMSRRRGAVEFGYVQRRISCRKAWAIAEKVGREAGMDPGILFGIMRVESALAVNAVSRAGAVGLMQIMPGPADSLGCGDRLDPLENARCAATILSRFLRYYKGDLILGLSAYNAGYGMPSRARKKCTIPANFAYPEKVLRVRARFLRWGCLPWE